MLISSLCFALKFMRNMFLVARPRVHDHRFLVLAMAMFVRATRARGRVLVGHGRPRPSRGLAAAWPLRPQHPLLARRGPWCPIGHRCSTHCRCCPACCCPPYFALPRCGCYHYISLPRTWASPCCPTPSSRHYGTVPYLAWSRLGTHTHIPSDHISL